MASIAEIAHRWANQKFGRYGTLTAGRTAYCTETTFYSYTTPYAQWLDKERKIMVVMDRAESRSSSKHLHHIKNAIPHDVTVFRTHRNASGGWNNVDFLDYKGELSDPLQITDTYLHQQYQIFHDVLGSASVTISTSLTPYNEAVRFASYFPKASIRNWEKNARENLERARRFPRSNNWMDITTKTLRMLAAIKKGFSFGEILDYMFGKGEWEKYLERSKGPRKRIETTKRANKIAQHLRLGWNKGGMTNRQILALTPLEMVNIKLGRFYSDELDELAKRKRSAEEKILKYLGITPGPLCDRLQDILQVTDTVTGDVLYVRRGWFYGRHLPSSQLGLPNGWRVLFDKNPVHFRKLFWRRAKYYRMLQTGIEIFATAGIDNPESLEAQGRHEEAGCLRMVLTRIARNERLSQRQEQLRRRAEEERLMKAKMIREQVNQLRTMGDEGLRIIWREHLGNIPALLDRDFFFGGNVLLRLSKDGNAVETSKHIKLSVKQAEKIWRFVSVWHKDHSQFRKVKIPTLGTTWNTDGYVDDILIAGCHRIAYKEMENMAAQLGFIDKTRHNDAV